MIEVTYATETSHVEDVSQATRESDFERLWLGLSREILDAQAIDEVLNACPHSPSDVVELIVMDYRVRLKQLHSQCCVMPNSSEPLDRNSLASELGALDSELWHSLEAIGDSPSHFEDIRRGWMRRNWLDKPGEPCALLSTGIDLARFVRSDWQSRRLLDETGGLGGTPNEQAAKQLAEAVREYELRMSIVLDDYRRAFNDNGRKAASQYDESRRQRLNCERFLLSGKPYAMTRKYAEQATSILKGVFGETAALAWRDRFLRANEPLLFKPQRGPERQCLEELDAAAWKRTDANSYILSFADKRWSAAAKVRELIVVSLSTEGEYPPNITNHETLEAASGISDQLDQALRKACRHMGADVESARGSIDRWGAWFPPRNLAAAR